MSAGLESAPRCPATRIAAVSLRAPACLPAAVTASESAPQRARLRDSRRFSGESRVHAHRAPDADRSPSASRHRSSATARERSSRSRRPLDLQGAPWTREENAPSTEMPVANCRAIDRIYPLGQRHSRERARTMASGHRVAGDRVLDPSPAWKTSRTVAIGSRGTAVEPPAGSGIVRAMRLSIQTARP